MQRIIGRTLIIISTTVLLAIAVMYLVSPYREVEAEIVYSVPGEICVDYYVDDVKYTAYINNEPNIFEDDISLDAKEMTIYYDKENPSTVTVIHRPVREAYRGVSIFAFVMLLIGAATYLSSKD